MANLTLLCSLGCEAPVKAKGLCNPHYKRLAKYGDPLAGPPIRRSVLSETLEERFWSKVNKNGPTPPLRPDLGSCWVWIGRYHSAGYGQIDVNGRSIYAHRLAYEWCVSSIPQDLEIDHLCRNRSCCRPSHLEAVPHRINILRGNSPSAFHARKTRCPKGHEYTPENTHVTPKGARVCKACRRERQKAWAETPEGRRRERERTERRRLQRVAEREALQRAS